MALFDYIGITEGGKNVKGSREADSQKTLKALLKKDGIYVTQVSVQTVAKAGDQGEDQGPRKLFVGRISQWPRPGWCEW